MKRVRSSLFVGSVLTVLVACGGTDSRSAPPQAAAKVDATPAAPTIPPPQATAVKSPEQFRVQFVTSRGNFTVEVTRALAPRGADRFYELVTNRFYEQTRFYRVVPGFITQWGIHGDTAVSAQWQEATIPDDPPRTPNVRGTISFAANGKNSRATEIFVATGDNRSTLDKQNFAPFGKVVDGMDVVEKISAEYGEEPNHAKIVRQGNSYLGRWFPALDYVKQVVLMKAEP